MNSAETVLLDDYEILVTDRKIVAGGVSRPVSQLSTVRVESSTGYRGKSVPFFLGLVFLVWALSELLNAPASMGWAAFAGVLAVICFALVRLVGGFQLHTVYLVGETGEMPLMQSRDGKAVSDVLVAVRQALAQAGAQPPEGWFARQPAAGR